MDFNKICSSTDFYRYELSGHSVIYEKCSYCDFVFTRFFDDWSSAEFSEKLYNDEYIKVDPDYLDRRPLRTGEDFLVRAAEFQGKRILDYGSGNGKFEHVLRRGNMVDVCSYDPFSMPLRPTGKFQVITAWEVVEHAPQPLQIFKDMQSLLEANGLIFIGTGLQPADIDVIRANWWYIGPRNGHCSIYNDHCLSHIAQSLGMHYGRYKEYIVMSQGEIDVLNSEDLYRVEYRKTSPIGDEAFGQSNEATAAADFRRPKYSVVTLSERGVGRRTKYILEIPLRYGTSLSAADRATISVNGKTVETQIVPDRVHARFRCEFFSHETALNIKIVTANPGQGARRGLRALGRAPYRLLLKWLRG